MTENQKLREVLSELIEAYNRAGPELSRAERAVDRMRLIAAREALALPTASPTVGFEDPRVQAVYELLVDDVAPPAGEHWEGFVARRIVDALFKAAAPVGKREVFEREMSKPPFEFCMDRWPDDGSSYAWPGNYAAYHTQCAWDAWQACVALSAGDAVDAQRYRGPADCNNYEAGLALIIDPKPTEQALGAAIDAAILVRGEGDPLTRYRVWPDGTVQEGAESPYTWMSDDFEYVEAVNEEQAALSAAMRKDKL